ncbi:hypothetical protein J437_LFUL001735 [Ladona fulva]|uniref:RRM domain-containing protein n=1 Tax=Ladona fulva TaxID=123851 RepID=A0A8K0K150_LADFU|nr:hypothetical protein J437_LFUL001735 [Ladona fulva]
MWPSSVEIENVRELSENEIGGILELAKSIGGEGFADMAIEVTALYVRNLMLSTSEERIQDVFSVGGGCLVERVKKIRDFAFVHFLDRTSAEKALQCMNEILENPLYLIPLANSRNKIFKNCFLGVGPFWHGNKIPLGCGIPCFPLFLKVNSKEGCCLIDPTGLAISKEKTDCCEEASSSMIYYKKNSVAHSTVYPPQNVLAYSATDLGFNSVTIWIQVGWEEEFCQYLIRVEDYEERLFHNLFLVAVAAFPIAGVDSAGYHMVQTNGRNVLMLSEVSIVFLYFHVFKGPYGVIVYSPNNIEKVRPISPSKSTHSP